MLASVSIMSTPYRVRAARVSLFGLGFIISAVAGAGLAAAQTADSPVYSAPPTDLVKFGKGLTPFVFLNKSLVTAYDANAVPLFRGPLEFLVRYLQSPKPPTNDGELRVVEWNTFTNMVHFQENPENLGLWVSCKDIFIPNTGGLSRVLCSGIRATKAEDGSILFGGNAGYGVSDAGARGLMQLMPPRRTPPPSPDLQRVPICPGDPRCPKI